MINIVGSAHTTLKSLVDNLYKVNKIKSDIFKIVYNCPHVESR